MRFPVSALLVALAATASSSLASAGTLERVRELGELAWGGDVQGGEPFVFEDPKDPGHLQGFEVDIAEGIARRLGVRAGFRQADWSNLIPALERGDFDIIMNGLEDTPARRARVALSRPYFVFGETLAVHAGDPAMGLAGLRGKRVGTLNQSYALDLLRGADVEPVLYEGVSEPYQDLAAGRLRGVLLEHLIAARYGCAKPEVRCLPDDVGRGTYVVAIRRDDVGLTQAVDSALSGMLHDGELRRILERWKLWDARQAALDAPATRIDPAFVHGDVPPTAREAQGSPNQNPFTFVQLRLFLQGALVTLLLSAAAFALALPLGLSLAILRLDSRRLLRGVASFYVEAFRGTPLLLQLYVLYFALAPIVRLDPITAAVLGLGLNYAAYEAEIHRGALLALPRGQGEAARALGLTRWQALRHVLLPQSLRIALPSMTNDFVALLKDSSLVSVITVVELTKRMTIAAVDFRTWLYPGLACAALYFVMSYPLARLAQRLERKLHRDHHPEAT